MNNIRRITLSWLALPSRVNFGVLLAIFTFLSPFLIMSFPYPSLAQNGSEEAGPPLLLSVFPAAEGKVRRFRRKFGATASKAFMQCGSKLAA